MSNPIPLYTLSPEIRDKLPEFARFPPTKPVIKDGKYYHTPNKEINWNNKHHIADKIYPYYHKIVDEGATIIVQKRQKELDDEKQAESARIAKAIKKKSEVIQLTQDRREERKLLQVKSHQPLGPGDELPTLQEYEWLNSPADRVLTQRVLSAKHATRTDNKWNFVLDADQKHVDQLLMPISVRGEERLHQHIQKKLVEEKQMKELEGIAFKQRYNEIRETFLNQHQKNMEFEKKCHLLPEDTTVVVEAPKIVNPSTKNIARPQTARPQTAAGRSLFSPKENARDEQKKVVGPIKIQEGGESHRKTPRLASPKTESRLCTSTDKKMELKSVLEAYNAITPHSKVDTFSSPRSFQLKFGSPSTADEISGTALRRLLEPKTEFQPRNEFDRLEYKGLWVKELDPNLPASANNFTRGLTAKSSLYTNALESAKLSRGTAKGSTANRPMTAASKRSQFSSRVHGDPFSRPMSPHGEKADSRRLSINIDEHFVENTGDFIANLEDKDIMSLEMNNFEEKHPIKRPGFSRVNYEETKLLTSGEGFRKVKLAKADAAKTQKKPVAV